MMGSLSDRLKEGLATITDPEKLRQKRYRAAPKRKAYKDKQTAKKEAAKLAIKKIDAKAKKDADDRRMVPSHGKKKAPKKTGVSI